jgi:hypothetical protein
VPLRQGHRADRIAPAPSPRETFEVLSQPAEQFAFLRLGRQVTDQFAFGDLYVKLLQMRLDVLHRVLPRRLQAGRRQPSVYAGGRLDLLDLLNVNKRPRVTLPRQVDQ